MKKLALVFIAMCVVWAVVWLFWKPTSLIRIAEAGMKSKDARLASFIPPAGLGRTMIYHGVGVLLTRADGTDAGAVSIQGVWVPMKNSDVGKSFEDMSAEGKRQVRAADMANAARLAANYPKIGEVEVAIQGALETVKQQRPTDLPELMIAPPAQIDSTSGIGNRLDGRPPIYTEGPSCQPSDVKPGCYTINICIGRTCYCDAAYTNCEVIRIR